MLFHPAKVPFKVISILFKVHSAHCEKVILLSFVFFDVEGIVTYSKGTPKKINVNFVEG